MTLTVAAAPFEATRPWAIWAWQSFSNLEVVLLAAIGGWGITAAITRRMPAVSSPLTRPWVALIAAAAIGAAVAPAWRANAWHMTARLGVAAVLCAMTVSIGASARRQRVLLWTLCLSGAVVSGLAILEYLELPWVLRTLRWFRPSTAYVGDQVRASGPLQYPTIASMYLEICFAAGLGLLLSSIAAGQRLRAGMLFAVLALGAEAIVLTFTRSGLIVIVVALSIVGVCAVRRHGLTRGVATLMLLAAVVAGEAMLSRPGEALRLRLSSEGQEGWYAAVFDAPATLTLPIGQVSSIPVRLTNAGDAPWSSTGVPAFHASYHWLEDDVPRVVEWEGIRTRFPAPVVAGDTIDLEMRVYPPTMPGTYRLVWDIEQVDRLWFATEPDAQPSETRVRVEGAAVAPLSRTRPEYMPRQAVRPRRGLLWAAAGRMLRERPITGVGLDNFRLLYGRDMPSRRADPRVHTNNLYLELVVGSGLLGAAALAWMVIRVAQAAWRAARRSDPLAWGAVAATAAIAVHGLADSFLGFTPTYVVMACALGLLVHAAHGEAGDAHRV